MVGFTGNKNIFYFGPRRQIQHTNWTEILCSQLQNDLKNIKHKEKVVAKIFCMLLDILNDSNQ